MDKVTPGIYHDKVGVALHDARPRMLNAQPGAVSSGCYTPETSRSGANIQEESSGR